MAEPGYDATLSEVSLAAAALPAAGDTADGRRRRDRRPAPSAAPVSPAGGWLPGLNAGCVDTVAAPMASRPGFGAADGGMAPTAVPSRVKEARPWPR